MAMKTAWRLNSPVRDTHSRTRIVIPETDTFAWQWTQQRVQLEGDKRRENALWPLTLMRVDEKRFIMREQLMNSFFVSPDALDSLMATLNSTGDASINLKVIQISKTLLKYSCYFVSSVL
jgi:hypothetical protein